MNRVLALVDASPSAGGVTSTAVALADLLDAQVETVTAEDDDGRIATEPETALLEALAADGVTMAVLGSRSVPSKPDAIGHVTAGLLARSPVPLVLVHPANGVFPSAHPRLLLPLDGTAETDEALVPLAEHLSAAGAEIVVFHVYNSQTVPPFLDSSRDLDTLATEFLLTHLPSCGDKCELRIGEPGREIIDRASAGDIDGVMVAWQRSLAPGRANVVRRLLRELRLPLLVVPIRPGR